MLNDVSPRPELSARVRSRVRELALKDSGRKSAGRLNDLFRRLAAPVACAAGASAVTAFIVMAQLAPLEQPSSVATIPGTENASVAENDSIGEPALPDHMLDPGERLDSPYILDSFVNHEVTPDSTIKDYAIGDERNDAMKLVNYQFD